MQSDKSNVLMIGLGMMGGAIAGNLARQGWPTLVFDLNPDAVARAVAAGATEAEVTSDTLSSVDYVVTSLPDPKAVRAVYLGEEGLAAKLSERTTVVEMSTIDPATMKEVEAACHRTANIRVLDVPVSGGIEDAAEGNATLMVGGDDADVESAEPLLSTMGVVKRSGRVAEAKAIKLINNYVAISNTLIAAEAVAITKSLGIDPDLMYSVLSQSGAASYQFNKRVPRAIAEDYGAKFSIALAEKDLRLLRTIVEDETELDLPGASAISERFAEAMEADLGAEDTVAILKTYL